MDQLLSGMRFLCDETRMLASISVAFGTPDAHEALSHGLAQEVERVNGTFLPCKRPIAPDSLYDLASLTKLFTAVLTMMLVERGMLSLHERIGEIDGRFSQLRDVTVLDVLSFRACLQTPGRIDDAPTREEGLERLFGTRPAPLPSIRLYSDINAMVIQYILQARLGMPLADAIRKMILMPVGMHDTYASVPCSERARCVCYNYEHRIVQGRYTLREDTPLGTAHDPKSLLLSQDGRELCGHAGLFSTVSDMVRFAQALLTEKLISKASLLEIGTNRTGRDNGNGTHRQYLGFLCFTKHPQQRLSEVPRWMGAHSLGLSGFTGNHLSIDPEKERFVLFLGNRCHARVTRIVPGEGQTLASYSLAPDGTGLVPWPDGRLVPSSAQYVYFKDEKLHAPIEQRMQQKGWL